MRDISVLHPRLQEKISEFRNLCAKQGLLIGIGECWRSVEEQDALYAKGRTIPGNVVTNARGKNYESMHQWYVAFDIYRMDRKDAFYNGDGFFDQAGKIGQSIGLEWGGYWRKPDKPHYQLPDWGSTAIKLRAKYSTPEDFKLSWEEKEVRYNNINEVPEWGKETIQKLIENGSIADEKALDLSNDMLRTFVILDRNGLIKEVK